MERLSEAGGAGRLMAPFARGAWELGRAARAIARRWGMQGPVLLACVTVAAGALALAWRHDAAAQALSTRLAARDAAAIGVRTPDVHSAGPAPGVAGARARLQAFDGLLLPAAKVPVVVQELLALGADEGLTMQRGSYRPQEDVAGGFQRYRMTLPVKGSGAAIQRFMKAALRKQDNLALDSVQFTRERIGSSEIEARIQWVLLVALPDAAADSTGEIR